jgi:demethylmenaquinone methyltransferase/2-methoxy-6-polyprenyl-1,4-benzoquinol methylase
MDTNARRGGGEDAPTGRAGHFSGPDVRRFDRFARLYHLAMPAANTATLRRGLAFATRPVERVLDVGGGTGRAATALGGATVVDAAPGMLAEARADGNEAVVGAAESLPVRDGSVDAVVVVDALHHFADIEAAVAEAARVLAPGGVLVIRDFDPTTLRGRGLVAVERLVGFESRFLTSEALADAVAAAGLASFRPTAGFAYTVVGVKRSGE